MPRPMLILPAVLLAATACSAADTSEGTAPATTTPASTAPPAPPPTTAPRTITGCTQDRCDVVNPTSGASLAVQVVRAAAEDPIATLILIPGGLGTSRDFTGRRRSVDGFTEAGFTVVLLDLDGRGLSGGEEDFGGRIHQDGLAAVIRAVADHPAVDPGRVAAVSFSYGITTASGALARHPDLQVLFLIDWEGPANRNDTGGCGGDAIGLLNPEVSCDDEAYWSEREASTSIASVSVPYLRLQTENDHVQPDNAHAVIMVNAATEGASPWTRLNYLAPNTTYDPASPPAMLPDTVERDLMGLLEGAALEMLELHG